MINYNVTELWDLVEYVSQEEISWNKLLSSSTTYDYSLSVSSDEKTASYFQEFRIKNEDFNNRLHHDWKMNLTYSSSFAKTNTAGFNELKTLKKYYDTLNNIVKNGNLLKIDDNNYLLYEYLNNNGEIVYAKIKDKLLSFCLFLRR